MILSAAGDTTLINGVAAHAQSTDITTLVVTSQSATPNVSPNASTNYGSGSRVFKSNEDPAHEAKESAQ